MYMQMLRAMSLPPVCENAYLKHRPDRPDGVRIAS